MTDVDLLLHRRGPMPDEPPYRALCDRCGATWPCPTRKAELQAEKAEIIRNVRAQVSDGARRVGVLVLIDRGVSVWSSTRVDSYGSPLGGVVVEIEDVPNRETGEFERFFTCLDTIGERYPMMVRRLAEAEVLPSGVQGTAGSHLAKLVKQLGGEVHDHKGSYLDPFVAERVRWMHLLTGLSNLAA